ncbi:hypothetical protein Tco_0078371 [Tanacetum coccineum]
MFKGLVLNDDEVSMSLLQYVNNALILGKWSRRNVRNLVTILNCFQDVYGLGLNLAKSSVLENFDAGGLDIGNIHAKNPSLLASGGDTFVMNLMLCGSVSSVLYMVLMVGSPLIVGMVCSTKKGLWEGITDCLVIDNMGIPFGDSFIKKKTTKIMILVIVRVRDSGEWGFLWDCRWLLNPVTSFLVKHISKLIDDDTLFSNGSGKTHEWNPLLPKKINIFVWRLALNRLPLLTTLADKGLDIPCILCHGIDTSINDKSVLDVIGGVVLQFPPSRFHKIFQGVCMYILWSLCKRRNKVVHAISETKDEELRVNIFPMAQANSLFWIANGSSKRLASCNSQRLVLNPKETFASSTDG